MNTTTLRVLSFAAVSVGVTLLGARAAQPTDLIVNGNFETGTLAGWTATNVPSGSWSINDGTLDPISNSGMLPPISGSYDVISNQGGPGFHALRQPITVPAGVLSARLSWNDRIRNWANIYRDSDQEFRVVILNSFGQRIYEVYSTAPGDPLQQVGPNSRSGDLTALFQAHAGQTLIVSFEEQDQFNPLNVTLDDIKLLVSQLPGDKGDCKDGGWRTFVNVNSGGQVFKNQGDCVSFMQTNGANRPAYN